MNGLYRAVCVDDVDPEGRGRIKVRVPMLTGSNATGWADPCVPPGWDEGLIARLPGHQHHQIAGADIGHTDNHAAHSLQKPAPKPGDGVWIMYEAGDIEHPVWMGVWL